jgi:hypothetical protein
MSKRGGNLRVFCPQEFGNFLSDDGPVVSGLLKCGFGISTHPADRIFTFPIIYKNVIHGSADQNFRISSLFRPFSAALPSFFAALKPAPATFSPASDALQPLFTALPSAPAAYQPTLATLQPTPATFSPASDAFQPAFAALRPAFAAFYAPFRPDSR